MFLARNVTAEHFEELAGVDQTTAVCAVHLSLTSKIWLFTIQEFLVFMNSLQRMQTELLCCYRRVRLE